MYDVVALGELLIDFTCQSVDDGGYPTMATHPGGAPANFLAALTKFGAKTAMLGKVGTDSFGKMLTSTLEKAGIDFGAIVQYKDYIEEYYGASRYGKLRFPERRTAASSQNWKVNRSLRAELDILEYFWNQPNVPASKKWKTVTVKGAREVMDKTRSNFAAMGLHFKDDKLMREFLESESWKSLKKMNSNKS